MCLYLVKRIVVGKPNEWMFLIIQNNKIMITTTILIIFLIKKNIFLITLSYYNHEIKYCFWLNKIVLIERILEVYYYL